MRKCEICGIKFKGSPSPYSEIHDWCYQCGAEEMARRIEASIISIARHRFGEGNYDNPYGDYRLLTDNLMRGKAMVYEQEIHHLMNEYGGILS